MITCKTKQWGNSIGVILPRDIVREKNIKPEEEIIINIEKKKKYSKRIIWGIMFQEINKNIIRGI